MRTHCPHCSFAVEIVADAEFGQLTCPACGSSFNLLSGDTTCSHHASKQRTISHFDLIDVLGTGAAGTVWKARDTQLDRLVAVKLPRQSAISDAEAEQFFREARAAAQLRHQNIVAVHEVGRQDGQVFIVSDLVSGFTLDEWLAEKKIDIDQAVALFIQLSDAIHHAHTQGVFHRDIKPSNIMLDSQLNPHIMDFGLARREAGEVTMTMDGKVLGTPAYMSPEQAIGESHKADAKSDVYSLGVVLFEVLTGVLPFSGSVRMLLHRVVHDEPPYPRGLNPRIPRDLETICLKCMRKDPRHRYATAGDLADDLRRFQQGLPVHASRPSVFRRVFVRLMKSRGLIGAQVILFGVVVAAFLSGYNLARMIMDEQIAFRVTAEARVKQSQLLALVGRQAERMQLILHDARLTNLLELYEVELVAEEDLERELTRIVDDYRRSFEPTSLDRHGIGGQFLAVHFVNIEDVIVCSVGASVLEEPVTQLAEYKTGKTVFTMGFPRRFREATRTILAGPILTESLRRFVVVVELDSKPMLTLMDSPANLGRSGEVVVARETNGALQLMDPDQDNRLTDRNPSSWPLVANGLRGINGYGLTRNRYGRREMTAVQPLGFENWIVIVSMNEAEAYEPLGRLGVMLFGFSSALLFVGEFLLLVVFIRR